MTGVAQAQAWTCLATWVAAAGVLVTTGTSGMVLSALALGCGGYRAYADGIGIRRADR